MVLGPNSVSLCFQTKHDMKVIGMGNALVDVIVPISSDQVLHELNLPKGSMQLLDDEWLKRIEQYTKGFSTELSSGGSAANTIHGLAALGVDTSFIGSIGKDEFGRFFSHDLSDKNILPMLHEMEAPTGRAMALVSTDSERTFGTYLGAAMMLDAPHINPAHFVGNDYFYIEGYLVQNHKLIETAVKEAKAGGLKVALDLASYNVVEENRDFLKSLLIQYVDLVFANEEEAKSMTGKSPQQAAHEMSQWCEIAVAKEGAKGASVVKGGQLTKILPVPTHAKDASGAGDLFASGFIYGELMGLPISQSGKIAALLSSKVIEFMGPKLPDLVWLTSSL